MQQASYPITVVGLKHYSYPVIFSEMAVGDPLSLMFEPNNTHDKRAIVVLYNANRIGYVKRDDTVYAEDGSVYNLYELIKSSQLGFDISAKIQSENLQPHYREIYVDLTFIQRQEPKTKISDIIC